MAAIAALNDSQQCVKEMTATFHKRQQFMLAGINKLPGFSCSDTQGAFYLFVDVLAAQKKHGAKDDIEFCEMLLDKAEIAAVPGSAFGTPNHIRISYVTSDALLTQVLQRLEKFA
jgi:aspartate aminotransferase